MELLSFQKKRIKKLKTKTQNATETLTNSFQIFQDIHEPPSFSRFPSRDLFHPLQPVSFNISWSSCRDSSRGLHNSTTPHADGLESHKEKASTFYDHAVLFFARSTRFFILSIIITTQPASPGGALGQERYINGRAIKKYLHIPHEQGIRKIG